MSSGAPSESPVLLHVYDLTGGLARQLSQSLLGIHVDGIWHTGIVVYGREYYYGAGIADDVPGRTPFGTPVKVVKYAEFISAIHRTNRESLGTTAIPKEVFDEFVHTLQTGGRFTMERYDLINNNCNHFTDEAAMFLTGKGIPADIRDLPSTLLSTPLGSALRPMIEGFQHQMQSSMFGGQGLGVPSPSMPPMGSLPSSFASAPTFPFGSTSSQSPTSPTNATPTAYLKHDQPVIFSSANIDMVFGKLQAFLKQQPLELSAAESSTLQQLQQLLTRQTQPAPSSIPAGTYELLSKLFSSLTRDRRFPVVDILRLIVIHPQANTYYTRDPQGIATIKLVVVDTTHGDAGKAAHVMGLRLLANLFAQRSGGEAVVANAASGSLLATAVEAATEGLLSGEKAVKVAAGTVLFNLALFLPKTSAMHAEALTQCISALVHVINSPAGENRAKEQPASEDEESDFKMLIALGKLLENNPAGVELARLLECNFAKYQAPSAPAKVRGVAEEVAKLIR